MVILKDILLGIWQAILSLVHYFAQQTAGAGIEADPFLIVPMLLLLTFLLGSAAWASSIASSRRHSPWLHFLIGLFVPYLYPCVILFAMDIRGAKTRQSEQQKVEEQKLAEEEEKQHIAELLGREETGVEPEPEVQVFDAEYFERIARDEQGNPTGPWQVTFGTNRVKVLRILEPLADVVAVEIEGRDGAPQRFRIPYSRITECEPC